MACCDHSGDILFGDIVIDVLCLFFLKVFVLIQSVFWLVEIGKLMLLFTFILIIINCSTEKGL